LREDLKQQGTGFNIKSSSSK